MKNKNTIFAQNSSWTFSKNVANKFDHHIEKSIPMYNEFHWLGEQLSDYYLKEDSIVYDIGCSTGTFLKKISHRHKNKKKAKYYGIDIVKNMIKYAHKKNYSKNIKYLNKDITKFKLKKSDLIISFYTIQFIQPKKRQELLNKIYKSLNWGGALFFVEKVRSYDARTQEQMSNIYEEFKTQNGFSLKEIINKKKSLKGILEPFSSKANLDMLKRAGFIDMSTVGKFVEFEFFLAIK